MVVYSHCCEILVLKATLELCAVLAACDVLAGTSMVVLMLNAYITSTVPGISQIQDASPI